jgi:hypothetical protein
VTLQNAQYITRARCWSLVSGILIAWVVLLSLPGQSFAIDLNQFRKDLENIASHPSRVIGSPGSIRAAEYVEQQLQAIPNIDWRKHEFTIYAPVTRRASLTLADGDELPVYPLWPAQMRVNSTPAGGITGRLVYLDLSKGYAGIRPADVAGQIAVVEASAGQEWSKAIYFGARAILILGSADTNHLNLRSHELMIPVNLPRFYVPPGDLADKLRTDKIRGVARLDADVKWEPARATNYYALVRGTSSDPSPALMFNVAYESSSMVPDLSPGASQAVQAAAGLALLRDFAARPMLRPVIVFFGAGDTIQLLATRNMFMALSKAPASWRGELADIEKKQAEIAIEIERAQAIASSPMAIDPTADRNVIDRIGEIIETDVALNQDDLFRQRIDAQVETGTGQNIELERLKNRASLLSRLRFAFKEEGGNLSDDLLPEAMTYAARALDRANQLSVQYQNRRRVLKDRIDLYQWLATALGLQRDPGTRENSSRLIELVVSIDLSDRGGRVGPLSWGPWMRLSNITDIQNYRDWFSRQQRAFAAKTHGSEWFGNIRDRIDFEPLDGARAVPCWMPANVGAGWELSRTFAVPGFAMMTLDDLRLRRDTPTDTLENLDVGVIEPQLQAMAVLFRRAWDDPTFRSREVGRWLTDSVAGQVVSPSPGKPVPDLPRPGFLVTYTTVQKGKVPRAVKLIPALGVRRHEIVACDAEGRYLFEGLPKNHSLFRDLLLNAYRLADDGSIRAAGNLNLSSATMLPYVDLQFNSVEVRNIVFNCEEFSLVGLYDPRYLQSLPESQILDARRNADPQRFNLISAEETLSGLIEPGMRAELIFRYGLVGNRLLLINMVGDRRTGDQAVSGDEAVKSARGFTAWQLNTIGPLALATSRDFWLLDDLRLEQYRRAGVFSSVLDELHQLAGSQIASAKTASNADDGAALMRDATGAWASEARVYSASQDMAQDVVRGAIFLLLLCVPFSFCMERLLVGTPNIYRQITGGAVIFCVMTLALWAFHPAFKISASPLIIVLSFAIILMSIVVIGMIYGKFDTELKKIRSGRGSAEGASFTRAGVLMSAVLLGIANMRKRRFRTALTSITIVLITFAVLCFTSATRYMETTALPTGVESAYSGVMLRHRGFRMMPEPVIDNLRAVLPDQKLVARWWNVNVDDPKEMINLTSDDSLRRVPLGGDEGRRRVFAVPGALGLSPGESEVTPALAGVLGAEAVQRLDSGETNLIYLSNSIATQLGVNVGDVVRVAGLDLEVASRFESSEFDQKIRLLSGETIAPIKYAAGMLDAGGRSLSGERTVENLDLDARQSQAELSGAYEHLSSSQYIIVPAAISRMLPNCSLRGVSYRLKNEAEVKRVSDDLARRFSLALFAGFDDGVRLVTSGSTLPKVSGAKQVAVPLAIAGLIIFNTMMGSIAERRREIHVYTSIGLAPLHVGALFVAEALTYGLIGTVFGYVIGQGVGTLMLKLGWLGNVTLNYSGTSAIFTMGLILLIVLLSALVPARLASKIAAPSIERTWKVPLPARDEIVAHLPFTINKTAADGALAYLAEFFEAHQEGSIGKFTAGRIEYIDFEDTEHRSSRGLKTTIWLTPFDLGVRQELKLLIHPGKFADIYEVQVILNRLSGDDGSWYRMNRSFLTELRKQFLQWRSLSPQKMLQYVEESRKVVAV